ncbi:MAG: hypothetical protein ABWY06_01625 [Pseudomonas sp.]|uniref:hypothetical protein n=1 Tax=Pseudomonas sp. TaxID=306 RepID=UPI003394B2C6
MTSFLTPKAQASSAAQAAAALTLRIDQTLSENTPALPSRLKDLVDRALGDLHFEYALELELAEAARVDLARKLAKAERAVVRSQEELAATHQLFESEQRAHGRALVANAGLETLLEKSDRDLAELAAQQQTRAVALVEAQQLALHSQADLAEAYGLLQAEQQAHKQALAANAALESQLEQGNGELAELGARLDAAGLRQAQDSAEQQAVEAALASAQLAVGELRQRLDEARQGMSGLEARATQAERAAEQARQQLEQQQASTAAQLEGLQQRHAAEQGILQQELHEQRAVLTKAQAGLGDLRGRLAHTGAEVEALRRHNATLTEQAADKGQRLVELGRTLAQAGERQRKSSTLISDAKAVLAESKQSIALLEVKLRDAREEAHSLRAELACARPIEAPSDEV